uniref:HIT domain-containing protein n=1 Tax=Quercus lobata TaxID=97700 RepID=A0A7N2REE9_QUELO
MAGAEAACIFCQIANKSTSATLLHTDEKVIAFQDINPSAVRSAGESVSHLLLHCPIASDLWAFLFCLAGICWVMPNSVVSMLESWNGILGSRRYGTVGVTLACMMWCIWGQGWRQDLMCLMFILNERGREGARESEGFEMAVKVSMEIGPRWHYLVIPLEHIPTVKNLERRTEDYSLVSHMLEVGQTLLRRDAPQCTQYRFGFHQPPLNSVNHLHLHCLALPYTPRWKCVKFLSVGSLGFLEAEKLLEKLKPFPPIISKV